MDAGILGPAVGAYGSWHLPAGPIRGSKTSDDFRQVLQTGCPFKGWHDAPGPQLGICQKPQTSQRTALPHPYAFGSFGDRRSFLFQILLPGRQDLGKNEVAA